MSREVLSNDPVLQESLKNFSDFDLQRFHHPWNDEWVIHGQAMQFLGALVQGVRPRRMIEFGSGRSTLVLADLLRGRGRILSFEHRARFSRQTDGWLRERGLGDVACLAHRRLTLRRYGAKLLPMYRIRWQEFEAFRECELALIDGPPGYIGREATLYELFPRMAVGGWIVADDMNRSSERRWLEAWQRAFGPALEAELLPAIGEGMAVLRKKVETPPHYPSFGENVRAWWGRSLGAKG